MEKRRLSSTMSLLIVDDVKSMRSIVRKMLETLGIGEKHCTWLNTAWKRQKSKSMDILENR